MKKILFTGLLLLLIAPILKAQPQTGDYLTNSNIDKFVGTWLWQSGNNSVTIQLKKVKFAYSSPVYYEDVLFGSHCFIENGSVTESTLGDFSMVGPLKKSSISLYNDPAGSADKVTGYIKNISLNKKMVRLDLEYVAGTIPQLLWNLSEMNYTKVSPETAGFTLPQTITLIRQ